MFGAMTARTTKDKTYEKRHRIEERHDTQGPEGEDQDQERTSAKASEDGDELKAGKAGLATYLFLSGKGKEEIAGELKSAFKLSDTHVDDVNHFVET
jgi:hypothetical protein